MSLKLAICDWLIAAATKEFAVINDRLVYQSHSVPIGQSIDKMAYQQDSLPSQKFIEKVGYGVQPTEGGLQPTEGGLQPTEGGLQPTEGGLQPTEGGLHQVQLHIEL